MRLRKLLKDLVDPNFDDIEILDISNDSREIKKGTLFFAYPGSLTDGRNYIDSAIMHGAAAIIFDDYNFNISKKYTVPVIPIHNLKNKLADIAARYYSYPTKSLKTIGVTGTNGKTTVAYQLAKAYDLLGMKSAYIGTIGQGTVDSLKPILNTTPDGILLQKLFYEYSKANVKQVCMEVSSHALVEGRVDSINFQQAIYTNLSHEHLDFHHSMQEYALAKAKLFSVNSLQNVVINGDDAYSEFMLKACPRSVLKKTYSLKKKSDYQATNCSIGLEGSYFTVKYDSKEIKLRINSIGTFNIYNSLAIFASLIYYEYHIADIVDAIQNLEPVNGRMELVAKSPFVFIDYSHTPDALENALCSLVNIRQKSNNQGKIWVIFGCGGDRDTLKRPLMGKVACKYADEIIITSDNPRTEDPEKIIYDVSQGLELDKNIYKIINRKEAILFAISKAAKDDTILIAGKGHEDYQIIGRDKFDFSDKEIVRSALNSL